MVEDPAEHEARDHASGSEAGRHNTKHGAGLARAKKAIDLMTSAPLLNPPAAVVGSMTRLTSVTLFAGKPLSCACLWISASSFAR